MEASSSSNPTARLDYAKLQPKFKECAFDSNKKPEYLRTWIRLLTGIVRNIPHGKPLENFLDISLSRRLHEASTRPAFLSEDIFQLTAPSPDNDGLEAPEDTSDLSLYPQHYYDIPEESQELDAALFHTLFTIVQGPYLDVITDLTGDYARYTFAIAALWKHGELGSTTRRIHAMNHMQELSYHGDASKWKLDFIARAREVYSSRLTIEHFIMHCAFKSFDGKSSQVQSMIAMDINSDKVGPEMNLEELANNYSTFLSTLSAGKSTGAPTNTVRCSFCKNKGHSEKDCRKKAAKGGSPIQPVGGRGRGGDRGGRGGRGSGVSGGPHPNITCHKCKKKGHYANKCPEAQPKADTPSAPTNSAQSISDTAITDLCKKLKSGEIKLALNVNSSPPFDLSSTLSEGRAESPIFMAKGLASTPYSEDDAIVLSACDGMGGTALSIKDRWDKLGYTKYIAIEKNASARAVCQASNPVTDSFNFLV